MVIVDTLTEVAKLRSPVVRSCHIGNNTANNWGWLALANNTRMVQYDHTRYMVDEVAVPWMLLGSDGIVEACFDHRGIPQQDTIGKHANTALCVPDRVHCAHLNYGIFANNGGSDLIAEHCNVSNVLTGRINRSRVSFDSLEIWGSQELLYRVLSDVAKRQMLHLIFDRWVRTSTKGYVVMQRIRSIAYHGTRRVTIHGTNGARVFAGTIDQLLVAFFDAMSAISKRLLTGERLDRVNYPWLTITFDYLVHAVLEYRADDSQRLFWHAGGSASSYYINEPELKSSFQETSGLLIALGYLPKDAHLQYIPTFSCQLFATRTDALAVLNAIVGLWSRFVHANPSMVARAIDELQNTTQPLAAANSILAAVPHDLRADLQYLIRAFNEYSLHHLPVAHATAQRGHPTYNKYGIAQRQLLDEALSFPNGLEQMQWGQAELLIKTLAFLSCGEQR
jgi:hypothetical protein